MSQNNQSSMYAGVDVAKRSLQLHWKGLSHELPNEPKGFAKLRKLLGPPGACHVVLEATGGYERALVSSLHAAGYPLSVVLPSRVRAFAYAKGQLAKTDPIDAAVLTEFGRQIQPVPSPPLSDTQRRLQELVSRRSQLVEAKTALSNQGEHYTDAWIRGQMRTQLRQLQRHIAHCETQITQLIEADAKLAARAKRMQEVPGVGPLTAAVLEAYVPELGTLGAATAAAITGLAPYPVESGTWHGPRSIRGGRKAARCALFLAAMSAVRHDAILKVFYQRLRAKGKKPMVALTAVMRKLVVLLNRLLKDPNFQLQSNDPSMASCSP